MKTKPRQTVSVDGMRLSPTITPQSNSNKAIYFKTNKKNGIHSRRDGKKNTSCKVKMHELLYQMMFHLGLAAASRHLLEFLLKPIYFCADFKYKLKE